MQIEISTAEVLALAVHMSHEELEALVPDTEQRFAQEASAEKEDKLRLCMNDAAASLAARFSRSMDWRSSHVDDTRYGEMEEGTPSPPVYVFTLPSTERRYAGREADVTQKILSFLADRTLANFYARNGQPGLAERWRGMSLDTEGELVRLLHRKRPPRLHVATILEQQDVD